VELVPKDLGHKKAQLQQLNFATAASGATDAPGTGLAFIPVYYSFSASAAGSAAVYAGTGGSELIRIKFAANTPVSGAYWDSDIEPAKRLVLEVEGAVGVGQFNVWYVVHRVGAGSSGTGQ